MNFKESEKYLYSLGNEVLAMKLGLENIRTLLAALGNPEKKYLKVQIAGTNGKGSTCAFLEAICLSAKIKTGMTTSPHLVSITERVKIDGQEISKEDFAKYATIVRQTSEELVKKNKSQIGFESVPTYFEQVTAIALLAFAEADCELVILETGLGGRFDATTAANAEIAAITAIDFDHQKILGNTLTEIAGEKAAIIQPSTKVVVGDQKDEALRVILDRCKAIDITPKFADYETSLNDVDGKQGRMVAVFKGREIYDDVRLGLSGRHQVSNARVAIAIAETLQADFDLPIGQFDIEEGLENARHKGRLEFSENFLFDGAHNSSGAKALREFLDEFIKQPITMIFGAMRDKDLTEIAEILFPAANKLIFTVPDNERSMSARDLLKFVPKDFEKEKVFITETVAEALVKAGEVSSKEDLILITGSLYLVGEAKKISQKGK